MTVEQGMDSSRVREVASNIDTQVSRLTEILTKGNASADLLHEHWKGGDGQALIVRWRSDAAKQIGASTELLRSVAEELRRQADEQDAGSGEGGGGRGGPGGGGSGSKGSGPGHHQPWHGYDRPSGYDVFERGPDSIWVRTNRDEHGNKHHYDPLTGKTWQEGKDGSWRSEQGPFGRTKDTSIDTTDRGHGWESTHESTRGNGPHYREYGESWATERSFDNKGLATTQAVLDNVQSEPIVEKQLWEQSDNVQVAKASVGDEQTGASAEFLAAEYGTEGSMGIDATRGAYVEANAEAGAYLGRAEAHYGNDYGTTAQGEAYIGAEANANAGAQIGPAGAKVEAGFDAFAGGKIEGGFSQDIGPADVGASGSLSYGIGAHADVGGELSMDKVGVSFDVGATLGVGGSLSFDVSVSPNEIVDGLADAGEAIADSKLNPGNWW